MPSTHSCLHYHVVFSTKERRGFLVPAQRERLYAYMGGALTRMDAVPVAVGGISDHVHLLFGLKPTHILADVVRELKANSSKWLSSDEGLAGFGWQEGYGAFTVSSSMIGNVAGYIRNQEEHHRGRSFQEEYLSMLKRHGVKFDERYLW